MPEAGAVGDPGHSTKPSEATSEVVDHPANRSCQVLHRCNARSSSSCGVAGAQSRTTAGHGTVRSADDVRAAAGRRPTPPTAGGSGGAQLRVHGRHRLVVRQPRPLRGSTHASRGAQPPRAVREQRGHAVARARPQQRGGASHPAQAGQHDPIRAPPGARGTQLLRTQPDRDPPLRQPNRPGRQRRGGAGSGGRWPSGRSASADRCG